jgi:Fe-S-cluster containining protein
VNDEEIAALAEFRGQPVEEVRGLYTRNEGGTRRSLKEKPNGDCVFYDRTAGCTVYPVRPRQCRTWPFWECNTTGPEDWARAAADCPGCNQGELIPAEEITRRVKVIRI